MGEVIYAASSLKAFGSLVAVILVLGLLGLMGVLNGIFRRKEKTVVRIARGCAGIFFWLLGAVLIYVVFNAMTTGSETMTVQVNDKQIATDNCVDGGTCRRYILESQSNARSIDLVVNEEAYNKVQIDSCYLVKYYSGNGLFGRSENGSSYDLIDTITRIETAACP
jgi:hypothetical protein